MTSPDADKAGTITENESRLQSPWHPRSLNTLLPIRLGFQLLLSRPHAESCRDWQVSTETFLYYAYFSNRMDGCQKCERRALRLGPTHYRKDMFYGRSLQLWRAQAPYVTLSQKSILFSLHVSMLGTRANTRLRVHQRNVSAVIERMSGACAAPPPPPRRWNCDSAVSC